MENLQINPEDQLPVEVAIKTFSKKAIEAFATKQVEQQIESGWCDVIPEVITASRMSAYWEARLKALRGHGIMALDGRKEELMGATVSISAGASRWTFNDSYLADLEAEIEVVKEKSKLDDERHRHHVTLSGESIVISKGTKTPGGEVLKVNL